MKQVLIETISFTPRVKLSEGKKSENGNPIVEGILLLKLKMVMVDIIKEICGKEKWISTMK